MATIKLGSTATYSSSASTSGVAYCCTGVVSGDTIVAPSDGVCSKMNIYVVSAGTYTINLAIYDNNGSPNYNRLAYQSYNQAWSAGWNQVTLSSPINITAGNTYHPAVAYPETITVPTYTGTGCTCWRHTGTLDDPWTDSTSRTYTPCVNLEYDTAPYGLTYDVASPSYRSGCKIYNNFPACSGSPTSYSVNPALPSGLTLNTSTGVISGTPTSTQSATSYTVTATNSYGSTTANVSITILAAPTTVTINVYGSPYSGGDYDNIQDAYDAQTVEDIVTSNKIIVFNCRGAVGSLNKPDGDVWTTGLYNYIQIQALPAYQHTGKLDGCTMYDDDRGLYWGYSDNLKIVGIALRGSSGGSAIVIHASDRITVDRCFTTNDDTTTGCIVFDSSMVAGTNKRFWVMNTMLAGNGCLRGFRFSGSSSDSNKSTAYVYNCVSINHLGAGFYADSSGIVVCKNCYAGNNNLGASGAKDFDRNASTNTQMVTTSCHSSDTSGNTQTSLANCYFVEDTAGSEDLNITSDSDLIGAGTDLRTDPYYYLTTDYEGETRAATPCVGSDEYLLGHPVVTIMQSLNQFNGGMI